jgi:hypothetical protein
MKQIIDWLMEDEQKDLFEIVFGVVVNLLFVALAALILWPLGRARLAPTLAKGYVVFWLTVRVAVGVLTLFHNTFRMNIYDRSGAFIISNVVASGLLQAGWSAFAVLTVRDFAAGASLWVAVALYAVAALSCFAALYPVGAFFQGHIYRLSNAVLAPLSFALFAAWPAAARAADGWSFNFFRE